MFHLTLALPLLLFTPQQEAQTTAAPVFDELVLTYLANDGFLLDAGPYTVMIDGFVAKSVDGYTALPERIAARLEAGQKPFRGRIFSLVSHPHPDHFQSRVCERFLKSNERASLISGPRVVQRFKEEAREFDRMKGRVRAIPVEPGDIRVLELARGFKIGFMQLPHVGELPSPNYGHVIDMGGFKVLHVGDAAADPAAFSALGFPGPKVDLAIVPFWFLTSEEGIHILDDLIRPGLKVVTHVPKKELVLFAERLALENPDAVLFKKSLETRTIRRPADPSQGTTSQPPDER